MASTIVAQEISFQSHGQEISIYKRFHDCEDTSSEASSFYSARSRTNSELKMVQEKLVNERTTVDGIELTATERRIASACFLGCGMGVTMCYTMIQSGIAFYSQKFPLGDRVYVVMLTAYNVPFLPVHILQAAFDRKFDVQFSSGVTFLFRMTIAMSLLAVCLVVVPFVDQTVFFVIVGLVGTLNSIAWGTASQLFSMFPEVCGGYYFIGSSLTSLLSIAITFGSGFASDNPTQTEAEITYILSAVLTVLGMIMALYLIRSPIGRMFLENKDATTAPPTPVQGEAAFPDGYGGSPIQGPDASLPPAPLTDFELIRQTSYSHASLFLTWVCNITVSALTPYVPSQAGSNPQLKLYLVYAGMVAALIGQQLNILRSDKTIWLITSQKRLLFCVLGLCVFSILYFLYLFQAKLSADGKTYVYRNDGLIIAYMAVFNMFAAYFSALSYGMAPASLPSSADKAQNSALLGNTLTFGIFFGLGLSYALAPQLS